VSAEIEIKGQGCTLCIRVLGYTTTEAENLSDANWLVCDVRASIGPFQGEVSATFTTQDFAQFSEELQALHEQQTSTASFETHEQVLELKVEATSGGRLTLMGVVRYALGPRVALSFALEVDQSYLPPVLSALRTVTKQFPVRGERSERPDQS
jgi:hypothetical protein